MKIAEIDRKVWDEYKDDIEAMPTVFFLFAEKGKVYLDVTEHGKFTQDKNIEDKFEECIYATINNRMAEELVQEELYGFTVDDDIDMIDFMENFPGKIETAKQAAYTVRYDKAFDNLEKENALIKAAFKQIGIYSDLYAKLNYAKTFAATRDSKVGERYVVNEE